MRCSKCLSEILLEVDVRGLMLHYNKTFAHSEKIKIEFPEKEHIKVTDLPSYFPDFVMYDFWLYFNLKQNSRGPYFHLEVGTE